MRKGIFFIIFLLGYTCVNAQQPTAVEVNNVRFEYDADNVYVSMNLPTKNYFLADESSLSLIPYLWDAEKKVELPKIVIGGNVPTGKAVYETQGIDYRRDVYYTVNVPYESWMSNARLSISKSLGDMAGTELYAEVRDLQSKPMMVANKPKVSTVGYTPVPKTQTETGTADALLNVKTVDLYYRNMHSSNVMELPDNVTKIENICSLVNQIAGSGEFTIVGIYVTGYTSPEGIFYDNEQLAKKRAQGVYSMLRSRCSFPESYYNVSGAGEDWNGLVDLLKNDDSAPAKYEILDIINNVGVFKGREKQLMMLQQGEPYRYMKKNLFPDLQKVECRIVYKAR